MNDLQPSSLSSIKAVLTPRIPTICKALFGILLIGLSACNSSSSDNDSAADTNDVNDNGTPVAEAPEKPVLSMTAQSIKTFAFSWTDVSPDTEYRLLENRDGLSGYTAIASLSKDATEHDLEVFLPGRLNASYILEACNDEACSDSDPVFVSGNLAEAVGYFKASNTGAGDTFGTSIGLSADGKTLAMGASGENSSSKGINQDQTNSGADNSGAVYVFTKEDGQWSQQAYLKASNTDNDHRFGWSLALSSDGGTLAVSARGENSNSSGIDATQNNSGAQNSGAIYVFSRSGADWTQQAFIKASNSSSNSYFGSDITISADGDTLAVSAPFEDGLSTGINGNQSLTDFNAQTGAVYVFVRDDADWSQQAYVKAFNTTNQDNFGRSVSLSADGDTLAVGAYRENSSATGTCRFDEEDCSDAFSNNGASNSGAVYVYTRDDTTWEEHSYIKASNTDSNQRFGYSLALAGDGQTLVVGARREASNAMGIDGDQSDTSASQSGAAYVFALDDDEWSQQAYIKASNTRAGDRFGHSVALSGNGNVLAVGAYREGSSAIGLDGDQTNTEDWNIGSVYVFFRDGTQWSQEAYVKASNTVLDDTFFGESVALSVDGGTLAVGASLENSNATGVGGDQTNSDASSSGAVYLY
ncbi:MAG: FG-GAP repeat protein [Saccharospirillum sp.]|nr:FG-GAP repeat protein [Saccharospirillum sp.]